VRPATIFPSGSPRLLLLISGRFAAISLIDMILVRQAMQSFSVFLNHRVENLDPFLKANDVIFGYVSWFRARAVIEKNAATLVKGCKFCHAPRSFFYCPRVSHVGTKIIISG
jgi:hypothetical protein